MKRFLVRLLASLPSIGVGISWLLSLVISFDYPVVIIPSVFAFVGFIILLASFEKQVEAFAKFLHLMADDALNE